MPSSNPRRRNSRLHNLLSGTSAGCTAFLLGALAIGILLVALSLRG